MDVPNPLSWAGDATGNAVASGAQGVLSAMMKSITTALADGVHIIVDEVLGLMNGVAGPNLDAGWWQGHDARAVLASVGVIAAALMVGCLLMTIVQGLLAGDVGVMVRAALVEVPVSICATVLTFGVTSLLLQITDSASAGVLQNAPDGLGKFFATWTVVSGGNPIITVGMLVVTMLAAFLLWIELMVRSALLYFLLALSPLVFAARVWPSARGACRKLCELGIALIASKFVVALALGLGAAALAGGGGMGNGNVGEQVGTTLNGQVAGVTLLTVSAFTPFVLLKLIPVVEGAVAAQGISRSPVRGGQSGAQTAYQAVSIARLAKGDVTAAGAATGGGGGGGSKSPPSTLAGSSQNPTHNASKTAGSTHNASGQQSSQADSARKPTSDRGISGDAK